MEGGAMTAKKSELLSEIAYRTIRSMILASRFAPGLRVNVEKLGRELGMSRPPVWEAIRRLEQEGVLRKVPNRGVFMIKNSLEKLFEQVQIRGCLDSLAGKLACHGIDDRVLAQMSRCLTEQLQAIENEDLGCYSVADLRFHRLIYEASGNVSLTELFDWISLQMTTVPSHLDILPQLPAVFTTHQAMFEGLSGRDEDAVMTGIDRHMDIVLSHLKEEIRARNEREEAVRRMKKRLSETVLTGKKQKGAGRQENKDDSDRRM
jgi:DNA-binding GntR family transcriptional regulator